MAKRNHDDIIDMSKLSDNDAYSLALLMIYKLSDEPRYSTISELAYTLDKENLLKFLKVFGGSTIKVPTIREFKNILRLMILYQYHEIEGKDWHESLRLSGFTEPEYRTAERYMTGLKRHLGNYNRYRHNRGSLVNGNE